MKKWIIYDPEHAPMMFPSGAIADRAAFLRDFPAIETFPHMILTDESEQICWAVENVAAAKDRLHMESESDENLLAAATNAENFEPEIEQGIADVAPPDERIAAALEFQNLLALEDIEE